ncbi:efflux RND transporter periplasmic adaptor subunit [Aliiglaciecola sp. LCG003]|uniref:efflux RND transporter periplasmic adaptor subunit n=1 Tax=Aliiglaciecola sp. LCG003 TaxID=3053655 RepID=UPI0025733F2A|nr:efflux RND transporter periplasmic adaptor subunit [Aliiglaciecola sp. LCG003]WJG09620.1 efflux RND transporter periplasmic adaptor subunit [Aliiglaciecola sp. LCG003]
MNNPWIKALLFFVVIGLGFGGMFLVKATAEEDKDKQVVDTRPVVTVETAESMDYQVLIHSFGEVAPLETTNLSAQVSGQVTHWNEKFVAGGLVQRGDVLFSIEKDAYEAALLQAEAELSQAKAALIEEQARGEVAKREASNLSANQVSDLYLRKPQMLSASASVKSAESKLKIAQRDLRNCEVKAPYDALVIARDIGLGEYVNRGTAVGVINNIETAEILFPIAGFDSAFLPASLQKQEAIVINKGVKTFSRVGYISRDIGIIDKSTRMSQLVVRVDDPYGLNSNLPALKYGSYVEVNISGQTLQNVYRLPQQLVTNRKVWVVDQDNKLQAKPVEIIREEGAFFIVSSGLNNSDRVVLTVPEYPQKGMEVRLSSDAKDNDLVAQQPES